MAKIHLSPTAKYVLKKLNITIPGQMDSFNKTPASLKSKTRKHGDYYLTEEQDHAVDLAITQDNLKIEAFAGAGKTSTLSAISSSMPKDSRGLYLAFNRSIALDAAQYFPSNVECKTAHSLAFQAIGRKFKDRLQNRLTGSSLAERLKITSDCFDLSPASIGLLTLETIRRFCYSEENYVTTSHAPWKVLLAIEDKQKRNAIAEMIVVLATKTWELMIDLKGTIPITHDVYLKLWTLSNPTIHKDFILFDEAQDANGVMLDLVCNQNAQQIFVGDRYQQIYSWRGAVNAMETIKTKHSCNISQSFRFGQSIADVANNILNTNLGANINIKGFEKISSSLSYIDEPKAILCRTNSKLISKLIDYVSDDKLKIAVSGGCSETISLLFAASALKAGKTTTQHDLALFKNWSELVKFSESDAGSDLSLIVKLMKDFDSQYLIKVLKEVEKIKEIDADIILSTAHKSKGREWASVRLEDDFRHPDDKMYSDEETNLLYVAATRAINILDISCCTAIKKSLD